VTAGECGGMRGNAGECGGMRGNAGDYGGLRGTMYDSNLSPLLAPSPSR